MCCEGLGWVEEDLEARADEARFEGVGCAGVLLGQEVDEGAGEGAEVVGGEGGALGAEVAAS